MREYTIIARTDSIKLHSMQGTTRSEAMDVHPKVSLGSYCSNGGRGRTVGEGDIADNVFVRHPACGSEAATMIRSAIPPVPAPVKFCKLNVSAPQTRPRRSDDAGTLSGMSREPQRG